MVDAQKAKGIKTKEKKTRNSRLPYIDLKSLIIGAAIYAFFPVVAFQNNIDILIAVAALGPVYIGYTARGKIKGALLGIVGGTPLLYLAFIGYLGAYTTANQMATETSDIVTAIIILGLSGVMGWFGAYLYQSRRETKIKQGIPVEEEEETRFFKEFEDTGSVSQNIVNLFKPKRK